MTNEKNNIDFGDDADVVPASDPAFDAWVAKLAPTLNTPGAAPRLDMWKGIQAARAASSEAQAGRIPGVRPLRRNPWWLMSVVAAALLLGVAIDRYVIRARERATPGTTGVATTPPTRQESADPARLYRLAATQTLTQAEALLTAYRASDMSVRNSVDAQHLARWGRNVLSSTRLLLDSPAGDDPQLRALLGDLELVLVQIIQVSGAPLDPADRELVDRVLEDRNLIPRIRTVVPAGVAGANTSSDD